MHKMQFGSN